MPKRVVVVGAGPCGLVALKEMREAGHEAVIFERSEGLGGVFKNTYSGLHLTISNYAMAFSDFPPPGRLRYTSADEYLRYLHSYAQHFGLTPHIKYQSEVRSARLKDGLWTLEVIQADGKVLVTRVEALIVATGANQVPRPVPASLATFGGRVLHSTEYDDKFKREVAEKKLRVLVVGGGESGADIATELGSRSPNNVTVWLRRPACVGPRYLNRKDEMAQVEANKAVDFPANGFLEAVTTNRMSAAQNVYVYGFLRRIIWCARILNPTLSRMCLASTAHAFVTNDQATYVTKNQRMYEALHHGTIEMLVSSGAAVCPEDGRSVEFDMAGGKKRSRCFDAIVLCHGFHAAFPWLQVPAPGLDTNPRAWFLHCFPPGLGQSLFFVGYARPHQGGIPAMAEMQSRYVALILKGERSLPSDYADQAARDEAAAREYYHLSPDLHSLVDYNAFLESVGRRVGCEPRLPVLCIAAFHLHMLSVVMAALQYCGLATGAYMATSWLPVLLWVGTMVSFFFLRGGLLIKWWFYPHWAMWYRQRGPGADAASLGPLQDLSIWKDTRITEGFVLLVAWSVPMLYMQMALSLVLFPVHLVCRWLGRRFPKTWGGLLRPKLFVLHSIEWRLSDLLMP